MAQVTHRVSTPSTSNTNSYPSGAFTPAVGDLLVVFVGVTASAIDGTLVDSQGGTYTLVRTASKNTSADRLLLFVANQLVASATSTTVTYDCTGDNGTGCIIHVASVAGMSRSGASAISQQAAQNNQAGGAAPAPVFAFNCKTTDPTLGCVFNATNPAGMNPPTNWNEGAADVGYNTPPTGSEYVWRNSGFTGTTITWASNSATEFCALTVELDSSSDKRHGTDSVLKKVDQDLRHGADSYLAVDAVIVDKNFSTDSVLKKVDQGLQYSTDSALKKVDQDLRFGTDSHLRDVVFGWKSCTFCYLFGSDSLWHKFGVVSGLLTDIEQVASLPAEDGTWISGLAWYSKDRDDNLYHKLEVLSGVLVDSAQSAARPAPPLVDIITDTALFVFGDDSLYHCLRVINGVLIDSYQSATLPPAVDKLHSTDSHLKRVDFDLRHGTDSFLAESVGAVNLRHSTDSALQKLDTSVQHSTDSLLKRLDQPLRHGTDSHLRDIVFGWVSCTNFYLFGDDSLWHKFGIEGSVLKDLAQSASLPAPDGTWVSGLAWYSKDRDDGLYHKLEVIGGVLVDSAQSATHPSSPLQDIITDTALFVFGDDSLYHTLRVIGGVLQDSYQSATLPPATDKFFSTDSLLKKSDTERKHGTDSYLAVEGAGTSDVRYSTDSLLKKPDSELRHGTDSTLKKVDSDLRHSSDSTLQKVDQPLRHSTDSVLQKLNQPVAHSSDSLLKKLDTDRRHGTDSYLAQQGVNELRHGTNSVLKRLDTELKHGTDSALQKVNQELRHGTNSALQKQSDLRNSSDSLLRKLDTSTAHGTSSVLRRENADLRYSSDSFLLRTADVRHGTDSFLVSVAETSHSTDSWLAGARDTLHSTDSFLELGAAPEAFGIIIARLRGSVIVTDPTTPTIAYKVPEHHVRIILDLNKNMFMEDGRSLFLWPTHGSRVTRVGSPYYDVRIQWFGQGTRAVVHERWLLDSSVTGTPTYGDFIVLRPDI